MRKRQPGVFRCERGYYTVEAALVMPTVLLIMLSVVFAAMYGQRHMQAAAAALSTAERTAYAWNDSGRNPITGASSGVNRDPLYWRLTEDASANYTRGASLGGGNGASLPERKLRQALAAADPSFSASTEMRRKLLSRTAAAVFTSQFAAYAPFQETLRTAQGYAEVGIVEPAELIRNTDLILGSLRVYAARFEAKSHAERVKPKPSDEGDTRPVESALQDHLSFASHADALRYLRGIVKGVYSTRKTVRTGDWRMIDALDRDGIAHQVYIGPKSWNSDMKEQLLKDAELLQRGEVRGVVWHFFRKSGGPQAAPNAKLASELRKYGVVVVTHE